MPLTLKPQTSNGSHGSQTSHATSTTSRSESDQFERPPSLSSQQSYTESPRHVASPGHVTSPALLPNRVPPSSGIIATDGPKMVSLSLKRSLPEEAYQKASHACPYTGGE